MGAPGSASIAPPSSSTTTGTGRFRRLFQVGKGGMGSVDVALERGDGSFQRIVALKRVLHDHAEDARNREMFFREARLAALLSHPNVVHAFNFGELNGEPFLTMEYVEGESLSRLIAYGADRCIGLPPPIAAHLLAELCEGLHAVHELRDVDGTALNVVHRDLSPHNVMVAYSGHVKLLDFGIAKFDTPNEDMTRTGEVKGKVAYMSPEQALGEKVDRRSDLYALGAILFELVTNRRMWGTGTELEVMRRLALEEPPSLRQALPTAPDSLVHLFEELVAKKREARPATAADVAARLREIARIAGGGSREALEQQMLSMFGDRAEERRRTMANALKAPETDESTRGSGTGSKRRFPSDMPTRSNDAVLARVESHQTSQIVVPRKRMNVALAGTTLVAAAALAITLGVLNARGRSAAPPPAQMVQPLDSVSPPPTPVSNAPTVAVSPPDPPPAQPTPTPSSKRVPKGISPVVQSPSSAAPSPLIEPSTQPPSPPPAASVTSKGGSGMPLINAPLP